MPGPYNREVDVAWLRGVFPPIPTPFANDGALGPPIPTFLEHLRDAGIDGVVALGSNGEAAQLSDAERVRWLGPIGVVGAMIPSRLCCTRRAARRGSHRDQHA